MKLEDWSARRDRDRLRGQGRLVRSSRAAPRAVVALWRRRRLRGKPGTLSDRAATMDGAPRVYFGVEEKDAKERDPFLAGKLATALPAGLYRLGEGVADPRRPRSPFCCRAIPFRAMWRPRTRRRGSARRKALTARASSELPAPSRSAATSSTRLRTTWGRRRWPKRRWRWRRSIMRRRASSSATRCSPKISR